MNKNMIGWTAWYCPVKNCGTIIYNVSWGQRYIIGAHKRKHKHK